MFQSIPKYALLLFLLSLSLHSFGQRNISGKKGLIYVPSAEESLDGEWSIGYAYNPIDYSLTGNNVWGEQIIYTNINLIPRFQISFHLLQQRRNKTKREDGIGDRQLDLRYQILKESRNIPNLAIILSSPLAIDAVLQTNILVASKTFTVHKLTLIPSLGLGSPYYIHREEDNLNNSNIFSQLTIKKKSERNYDNKYLIGFFGGIKCSLYNKYHILAEWDGQKINTGLSATFLKKLNAQVNVLNFDQVSFGFSYTTNLKAQQ